MTIPATDKNRTENVGNGVTVAFSFPHLFFADADLVVLLVEIATGTVTTQVLTTNYTVTGAGNPAGGTVTFIIAPPATHNVVIFRDPALTQGADLVENDPLPVETAVEQPLDRLTMIAQRTRELGERSLQLPDGDTGFVAGDMQIPPLVVRKSTFAAWDADGKPIASTAPAGGVPVSTFMETVVDDVSAVAARTTLGITKFAVLAGTNTYTGTLAGSPTTLVAGEEYVGKFVNAATITNPTVNFNSFGAKTVKRKDGGALTAGDLPANFVGSLLYDGTDFLLQNARWDSWETGETKGGYFTAANNGWVLMDDGSIGSATSGGTTRANADTESLFTLLWDNVIDTWAPVSTGRGASAAADFAANKTLTLPKALGRVLSVSGTGAGLTARALGENLGEESHVQTEAELDPHGHNETYRQGSGTGSTVPAGANLDSGGTLNTASDDTGSGTAFNVMQPASFCNVMIKL